MPSSPVYVFVGTAAGFSQQKVFSDSSRTLEGAGGYKMQCDYFTIQNMDNTSGLNFSFDNTSFINLNLGGSWAAPIHTDRYYVKSDNTNGSSIQVVAVLHSDRYP